MRFWDSSAIVPLLVRQSSTTKAQAWFGEDPAIALWTLSHVEITSALWRLARDGEVAESAALTADARAGELVAAGHVIIDVDAVTSSARRLLRVHALRAADALQLGAALLWSGGRPQGRTVLTLDDRLALAARREGFHVP